MGFPISFPDRLPVQIEPCPIVEPIFEVRFAANDSWTTLPGLLYAKVRDRYSEQKALPLAELPEEIRRHDPALAHLPLHQFISKEFFIQLGPPSCRTRHPARRLPWVAANPRRVAMAATADRGCWFRWRSGATRCTLHRLFCAQYFSAPAP